MKLNPHISLVFNGQCEAAFEAYAQCLGGSIAYKLTWGASPMAKEAPPGWESKLYHATLKIGDTVMSGGDVAPDRYEKPQGFSVVLEMDDPAAAERIFESLAEGGRVQMPLQETFWAARFAALVDRFGVPWIINCEKA
jgi:PhnB protein